MPFIVKIAFTELCIAMLFGLAYLMLDSNKPLPAKICKAVSFIGLLAFYTTAIYAIWSNKWI